MLFGYLRSPNRIGLGLTWEAQFGLGLGLELVWVSLAVLKEGLGLNWASSGLEAIGLEAQN
jgi:hypothetical protein